MSLPRDRSILFIFSKNSFIVCLFYFILFYFCLLAYLLYGLCNAEGCLQFGRSRFISWVGKIHWRRDRLPTPVFLDFPCGSGHKESTCNRDTWVQSLGWDDPLEKRMATHSSILAWRIPWRHKESDTTELTFTFMVSILFISSLISIIIITSFCYFWSFFFF